MADNGWPLWYCPVCGEADGSNAAKCCDCNDYLNRHLPAPGMEQQRRRR